MAQRKLFPGGGIVNGQPRLERDEHDLTHGMSGDMYLGKST